MPPDRLHVGTKVGRSVPDIRLIGMIPSRVILCESSPRVLLEPLHSFVLSFLFRRDVIVLF